MTLNEFFKNTKRAAIAFSGGADSSYLLYAAKAAGCEVRAYIVRSEFQPEFELEDANRLTKQLGIPQVTANVDILDIPAVAENPPDRCYHCKKAIFTRIQELAEADGFSLVLCDGTNADDDEWDRPGMRALRELGVVSPLRECGIAKAEVRRLSKAAGLFTHNKPAYACLATRIPSGTLITRELLAKIERAENKLFKLGFSDFRVRFLPPDCAVIELLECELDMALKMRTELVAALGKEFNRVTLNLKCR